MKCTCSRLALFLPLVAPWLCAPTAMAQSQEVPERGAEDPEEEDEGNGDKTPGTDEDEEGDPVDAATGAFSFHKPVLSVPSRNLGIDVELSYLSSAWEIGTTTGARWMHTYEERIVIQYTWGIPPTPYPGPADVVSYYPHGEGGGGGGGGGEGPWQEIELRPLFIDVYHYHDLRIDHYRHDPVDPTNWLPEPGIFTKLKSQNVQSGPYLLPRSFYLRKQDGTVTTFPFELFEGGCGVYTVRPGTIEDRRGDRLTFGYESVPQASGCPGGEGTYFRRLTSVTDVFGRQVTFDYDAAGWLESIRDFTGREARLEHDWIGNVTAIVTPTVTTFDRDTGQTPYAARTELEYSPKVTFIAHSGHNIVRAYAPLEVAAGAVNPQLKVPYLQNTWDLQHPAGRRVVRQDYGGTNTSGVPAGGAIELVYETHPAPLNHGWFHEKSRTLAIDANGFVRLYLYDESTRQCLFYQFTGSVDHAIVDELYPPPIATLVDIDAANPSTSSRLTCPLATAALESHTPAVGCRWVRSEYNAQNLVTATEEADSRMEFVYDASSPDVLQRPNLLVSRQISTVDPNDRIVRGTLCEPLYNQTRLELDPRTFGSETPPNGASTAAFRYGVQRTFDYQEGPSSAVSADVAYWGIDLNQSSALAVLASYGVNAAPVAFNRGDVNEDGQTSATNGDVIAVERAVNEHVAPENPSSAFVTRTLRTLVQYNSFSQPTRVVDPDGFVSTYGYYSASDPLGSPGDPIGPALEGLLAERRRYLDLAQTQSIAEQFGYDDLGRRNQRRSGRGWDSFLTFDERDRPAISFDALGHKSLLVYDANDNVIEEWREHREPVFDPVSRLPTGALTAPRYVETWLRYDILDNLLHKTMQIDSAGATATIRYRYDKNGDRVLTLYPEWGNDHANVLATVFDEFRNAWTTTQGGITAEFAGLPWMAAIPERASIPIEVPDQTATTRHYFAVDRPASTVDPEGGRQTYSYDGFGRRIRTTDILGNYTELDLDRDGNVIRESSFELTGGSPRLLRRRSEDRDELGRVYETRWMHVNAQGQPVGDGIATERKAYDGRGNVRRSIDDRWKAVVYVHDGAGRPISATDPAGNARALTYDADGNLIRSQATDVSTDTPQTTSTFNTWLFHDPSGRISARVNDLGHALRFLYDSSGNLVFLSDAQSSTTDVPVATLESSSHPQHASLPALLVNDHGNTSLFTHDDMGYLLDTVRHMRRFGQGLQPLLAGANGTLLVRRTYDLNGRLHSETDGNGNVTSHVYDALNRETRTTFGDQTTLVCTYYSDGLLETATDANQTVITYTYDAARRLERQSAVPGPGVVGHLYDQFSYDGLGRVVVAWNQHAHVTREYDSLSNLTRDDVDGRVWSGIYDGAGNLVRSVYPGGRTLELQCDDARRLRSVKDLGEPTSLVDIEYLGVSRERSRGYRNSLSSSNAYDAAGQVASRTLVSPGPPAAVLDQRVFLWDRAGNKLEQSRQHLLPAVRRTHAYDSAYRMTRSKRLRGTTVLEDVIYDLDQANNRTEVTGGAGAGDYTLVGLDALVNEYTTTPFDARMHDANGNLVTRQGIAELEYDFTNRMNEYRDTVAGKTHLYRYDPFGRRVEKIVDANGSTPQVRRYAYDPHYRICEEQNGSGATLATYVWAAGPDAIVSMRRDADGVPGVEDYYYHADDLGNVLFLSNAAGSVVERYEYSDYGQPLNGSYQPLTSSLFGNPFFFNGKMRDAETGLYDYRCRYLEPATGRFTTRDPIGVWGDGANLGNSYAYCGNNPWSRVDPYGLDGETSNPLTDSPRGDCRNSSNSGDEIRGDCESHGSVSGKQGKSGDILSVPEYEKSKGDKAKEKVAELQARIDALNKDFKECHEELAKHGGSPGAIEIKLEATEDGKVKLICDPKNGKDPSISEFNAMDENSMKDLDRMVAATEDWAKGLKILAGICKSSGVSAGVLTGVGAGAAASKAKPSRIGNALRALFGKSKTFQQLLDRSGQLLKAFEIEVGGKKFYVPESGTKHFKELMSGKLKMSPEDVAKSFANAVEKLAGTKHEYGKKVMVEGWEFIVEKGKGGPLDCIVHAVPKALGQ